MTPIDLLDFTNSKKKIPKELLNQAPEMAKDVPIWKILAAYYYDFATAAALVMMISMTFELYFLTHMITRSLEKSFNQIDFVGLSLSFAPLLFTSYFFFSNFFNQGQTLGMHQFKIRIQMEEMNFKSSLLWAIFSTFTILTCGLIFPLAYNWMTKNGWGKIESHDHLYIDLLKPRTLHAIDLVKTIEESQQMAIKPEYETLKAA
jgi:uncharacterized RDD family membrane protein YckC